MTCDYCQSVSDGDRCASCGAPRLTLKEYPRVPEGDHPWRVLHITALLNGTYTALPTVASVTTLA